MIVDEYWPEVLAILHNVAINQFSYPEGPNAIVSTGFDNYVHSECVGWLRCNPETTLFWIAKLVVDLPLWKI